MGCGNSRGAALGIKQPYQIRCIGSRVATPVVIVSQRFFREKPAPRSGELSASDNDADPRTQFNENYADTADYLFENVRGVKAFFQVTDKENPQMFRDVQ
jgi:hypothetical protein